MPLYLPAKECNATQNPYLFPIARTVILCALRKLNPAYAGHAIRVRRSSDDAEQDIGFSDGVLDVPSLLDFVGTGDGYVAQWYDQSGRENHMVAAATHQARIVMAGQLQTQNGKPSIRFAGEQYYDVSLGEAISGATITASMVAAMSETSSYHSRLLVGASAEALDWTNLEGAVLLAGLENFGNNMLTTYRNNTNLSNFPFKLDRLFAATSFYTGREAIVRVNSETANPVASTGDFNIQRLRLGAAFMFIAEASMKGFASEFAVMGRALLPREQDALLVDQMDYFGI